MAKILPINIPNNVPIKYKTDNNREKTIGILGSSSSREKIMNYMQACSNITKGLVLSGKNIVHGCGNAGIMGAAYDSCKIYSNKDDLGRPEQSLAIIAVPMWGDEDLENCKPIATAKSEADRIEKFAQVANKFIIFPGGPGTIQEVSTLISKNYYGNPEDRKQIILVGKDFYKGIQEQYQELYDAKLIKCPPEELFTVVDTEKEVMDLIK